MVLTANDPFSDQDSKNGETETEMIPNTGSYLHIIVVMVFKNVPCLLFLFVCFIYSCHVLQFSEGFGNCTRIIQ